MHKSSGLCKEIGPNIGEAIELLPPIFQIVQKHGDVIIRIGVRIAACARAEQNDPFQTVAIGAIQCCTKSLQHRVVCGRVGHAKNIDGKTYRVNRKET